MGISELRQIGPSGAVAGAELPAAPLDADLVGRGAITEADAALARLVQAHCDTSLDRVLVSEGLATQADVLAAHARAFKSRQVTSTDLLSMHPFEVRAAPALLLRHAVLPVVDHDGAPALVCAEPGGRAAVLPYLPAVLCEARVLWAKREAVQDRLAQLHRAKLTRAMVSRVPDIESCRTWSRRRGLRLGAILALVAATLLFTLAFPRFVFEVFAVWAVITLVIAAFFKTAAFIAHRLIEPEEAHVFHHDVAAPLPKVSVLVPLFRETEILHALVTRLSHLTYPKCLLDVILVLEEADENTRRTLASIDLPSWIRPVVVPDGQPRTKPRAMNYALDFCEGDIVGIFDAEDAPDPDQITKVAKHFQTVPPDVVCLQCVLDYYNPRQNWLARCFTIEYAAWFRLVLPGMAHLGLAFPLGGTSLYFRREVLEELGGWDAHNVTEDADLGFRLARHGYRTQMLNSVTHEEANCLPWAWVRQRSRWLKGYMTTYLVHMRRPALLWRQLGSWRFLGFQAHFVTALSQFFLAPVLWTFWLVLFGLPHPLDPVVSPTVMLLLGAVFVAIEVINLTIYASAVRDPRHRHLLLWTPTMHFYTPLGTVAAYKALYELVLKPFFWDKTYHGLSLHTAHIRRSLRHLHLPWHVHPPTPETRPDAPTDMPAETRR